MHAALDLNIANHASAIVTTKEVVGSISSSKPVRRTAIAAVHASVCVQFSDLA